MPLDVHTAREREGRGPRQHEEQSVTALSAYPTQRQLILPLVQTPGRIDSS